MSRRRATAWTDRARSSTIPAVLARAWLRRLLLVGLSLVGLSLVAACRHPAVAVHDSGEWGPYDLRRPRGEVLGLAFLLSGASGIDAEDRAAADALTRLGLAVALVDTRVYLARVGHGGHGPCLDVPGAFLWTNHVLEQELGLVGHRPPSILGRGAGGLLAYVALAQSPANAVAGGAGIDLDTRELPMTRDLCGLAVPTARGRRRLGAYRLAAPWKVGGTRRLAPDLRSWRQGIVARNPQHAAVVAASRPYSALVTELVAPMLREAAAAGAGGDRMPVVEVKPVSAHGVLVVVFSGDGGWRDIDKSVGRYLADHGLAVLGVDALSYFWERRTPDETGADAAAVLRTYLERWRQRRVALVGYSFGADILPFVYNRLPAELQERVLLVSLLAPGRAIEFEIHVTNWLGGGAGDDALPIPPEVARVPDGKLQCIYGADEGEDTLCTDAAVPRSAVVRRAGDHHFDGDYDGLAAIVLDGITHRLRSAARE